MEFWLFNIPNYILAILFYTVLGRLLLGLFAPEDTSNYIMRWFVNLSNPVVKIARLMAPKIVPHFVVLIFTAIWLLLARFAFVEIMLRYDLVPTT